MDIFEFAKNNDLKALKENLKYVNINIIDESGNSLLYYAVMNNNVEMTHFLILNHININILNSLDESALGACVKFNAMGCFRALIRAGCNINIKNKNGESPLFEAFKLNRVEMIDILLSYNALTNFVNEYGENVCFMALNSNNLSILDNLLSKEPSLLYSTNLEGDTLLHKASKLSNIDAIKYLLSKGILANALNNNLETPLFYAARNNDTQSASLLIEHGALIEYVNRFNESIFDVSKSRMRDFLHFKQTELKYIEYIKKCPLCYSVILNDYEMFLRYLSKLEIKKIDDYGHNAMYYALNYNRDKFIKKLNEYNNSAKNRSTKIIN